MIPKEVREYMSKIGSKGGKKSRRTWTEEQKRDMVKKKAETLLRKKVTGGENE